MSNPDLMNALIHIKNVSEKMTESQEKALQKLMEQTEKKIDLKINAACKKLSENAIAEIKERLDLVNDSEKLHQDIKDLKRITEDLIDRQTILTEVAYLGRQRLSASDQSKLNADLIRSMDFRPDWFKKRNNMSLNELFNMYHNGNIEDVNESK